MVRKYDTRQREQLLAFLRRHPDQQLSVREIAGALSGQGVSVSAVYRNLSRMEAAGLILRSIKPGGREACYQYVGAPDCRSHLHLSCVRCGRTFHMDAEHTRRMARALSELDCFELDVPQTTLYGICQNCRRP